MSLSGDRVLQFLSLLAVLLFVSYGVVPRGHRRHGWSRWVKWGSVAVFSAAILCARAMILLWAVAASRYLDATTASKIRQRKWPEH
jgi:hypothetical protein